jgi:hypothetical protein
VQPSNSAKGLEKGLILAWRVVVVGKIPSREKENGEEFG